MNNNYSQYRIYKPTKDGKGAATSLQLSFKEEKKYQKHILFLIMTKQKPGLDEKGNAQFCWTEKENTITVKLEETDIGQFLAVLNGKQKFAGTEKGMFHKNSGGNTVITFTENDKGGYLLRLSTKKTNGESLQIYHSVTIGEAQCLKLLFERALIQKYGW